MDYPKRKNPRLAAFDYSAPNIYFLTLCTRGRNRCLSRTGGGVKTPPYKAPGSGAAPSGGPHHDRAI